MGNETLYLAGKITVYTMVIILMIYLTKRLITYYQDRRHILHKDKRLRLVERVAIGKDSCLLLVRLDDQEMLLGVSNSDIKILVRNEVGEDAVEKLI